MRRAYGFAIVELLIVTVVIGILAVIAYATYRDGQERDMVTNRPQPPIGQYMKREDSQIRGGPLHYDNDGDVQAANCTGTQQYFTIDRDSIIGNYGVRPAITTSSLTFGKSSCTKYFLFPVV